MRQSILLFSFIFLFSVNISAQIFTFGVPNLEVYDKQLFHPGFSLGIDIVDINLKTRINYEYPDNISPDYEITQIYSKSTPAFNVGIVANLRLGRYFDLRFIPGFSIAHDIDLYYKFATEVIDPNPGKNGVLTDLVIRKIECHYINFPLFIKFKSSRMHNVRIYVIGGGQFSLNMMSAKNNKIPIYDIDGPKIEIIPIIKPYDVQVLGGFGLDFYTTYFKFSTEFKVSFGVINLLESKNGIKDKERIDFYQNSPIVTGIKSLKSKTFTISFIFE
ncbi:MAG: PorT family protein [Bacteroidales bacterium]|jgi:hypothetical protein|nr:PorT family protein [Bacteroidales bacterium]